MHPHLPPAPAWPWLAAAVLLGAAIGLLAARLARGHTHAWVRASARHALGGDDGTWLLWACARRGCPVLETTWLGGRWPWQDIREPGKSDPTVPNDFYEEVS